MPHPMSTHMRQAHYTQIENNKNKNLKPKETKALIYFQTTSYLLSTQNSTYQCSRFLSSEVDMQRGLEGEKAVREMELLQTTVKVESKGR